MVEPLTFQDVIIRLQTFWAEQGCIIWQPYNVQVGAGTMNPATYLRVLGPEPWKVAYVEPSIRPDDGRYGDNPNRMQMHHQFQVILKPDPGNPQEVYLKSLEAIGIDRRQHDIRFVEDNWESPALGAWGLGWEVWLDGQEITQFTYFQQAGGQALTPNSVEITYGLERIVLALQNVDSVWNIDWTPTVKYGDVLLQSEIEQCRYYFEVADIPALKNVYNTYENESKNALAQEPPLVITAHDYLLKCSHLFNVLDTRGAIGVVERADYFKRMQTLASKVGRSYTTQRLRLEYPMLPDSWAVDAENGSVTIPLAETEEVKLGTYPSEAATFVLEIGVEELPAADLDSAIEQLQEAMPTLLEDARLSYGSITVGGTPRRLLIGVSDLAPQQTADERTEKGPPTRVAFDSDGEPTRAAEGFAQKYGASVDDLKRTEIDGGEYITLEVRDEGLPAHAVLSEELPKLIASIRFDRSMRWNQSAVTFSRPLRWFVALLGEGLIPFTYADVQSNRFTRGTRPMGSPLVELSDADSYTATMQSSGIITDPEARRVVIIEQLEALAKEAGGALLDDPSLLDEVTNLVEQPTAFLGRFEETYLELPDVVLTTVMKKHQRYFAVVDDAGALLPVFIAVRNGDSEHLDSVTDGNEQVVRARFADARFFYEADIQKPLTDYVEGLKLLTFQEALGSYYDKSQRLEEAVKQFGDLLSLSKSEVAVAVRAAQLCKADLNTGLVVEMTSLQGVMGKHYATKSGETEPVALAIEEHYLPRYSGDTLPDAPAGVALALADRLDSLVGLLAVDLAPTGSADPYALRRAAGGVVQIAISHQLNLDLREAIQIIAETLPVPVTEETQIAVIDFIAGRLHVILRDQFAHDVVEAVLGEQAHNPYRAWLHTEQLSDWVSRDNWELTLDAYARCVRITRKQEQTYTLNPDALAESVEKDLYAGLVQAKAALTEEVDVNAFLTAFSPLAPAISAFFAPADEGGVMVMDKDQAVRENRLALLQEIVGMAQGTADFSQLQGF